MRGYSEVQRDIVMVGLNHRTAPIAVRERVAFSNGQFETALRGLVGLPRVQEGVIVSTCNRVELILCGQDTQGVTAAVPEFLAAQHGMAAADLAPHLYVHAGREAVRHVFRVASSLDSMIVGEPQILGQMKEQYAQAAAAGAAGRVLHRCFHKAFSVAKRIRSETGVAERAVSVGSAAVELARGIFDRFPDKTALLIGAGTMGELVARQLLSEQVGTLYVVNRTFERAIDVARSLGGIPVPFDRLARHLPQADLIAVAATGEDYLLDVAQIEHALRERQNRPMLLIDLAVPRAIHPGVRDLDGVYLYDIDDLDGVVTDNRGARARAAVKAEAIIDGEVELFWRWFTGLDVVPTIVALREQFETLRVQEVERHVAAGKLGAGERAAVDQLTHRIVNKILHMPVATLRDHQGGEQEGALVDAVRRLFRLPGDLPVDEDD
jgi:glutamyl-tRNA reductase